MRTLLLNGPNLNLLGTRRPDVYGSTSLQELEAMFAEWASAMGVETVAPFQSNHEGAIIDRIHDAVGSVEGIVFNPGAFTHTSYAIHDAIEAVAIPTVEVHISNVEEREPWRRLSVVRPACAATIYGRGLEGYRWGLQHLVARDAWPVTRLAYGTHPDQYADLRSPSIPTPAPLVVIVHGGFWKHVWAADITEMIAIDLARRGVATLNVEYRRVGKGGGGQVSIDDLTTAIGAALSHHDVDATRWALAGHSAGGQLALLAGRVFASRERPPRLVASMGGVSDIAAAISDNIGLGAAAAYVGDADAGSLSPQHMLPIGAPIILAHGTADDRVPFRQAAAFLQAATAEGDHVTLLDTDGGGHFEFLDDQHPMWIDVAERIVAALDT